MADMIVLEAIAVRRMGSSPFAPTIFSGRKYFRSRKPVCLVVMNSCRRANGGKDECRLLSRHYVLDGEHTVR